MIEEHVLHKRDIIHELSLSLDKKDKEIKELKKEVEFFKNLFKTTIEHNDWFLRETLNLVKERQDGNDRQPQS